MNRAGRTPDERRPKARRRRTAGVRAAIALVAAQGAACRPPAAELDPLRYLAVGVEPREEARTEERALMTRGYRVRARVDGTNFVALGASTAGEERSAVRVITERGMVLGVDAPSRDRPTWTRVELLESASGRDLDGDETEEIVLRVRDSVRFAPCLAVVRVTAEGAAYEVTIDTRAHGERACIEAVGDVERDGRLELFVGYRPWHVPGAPVPVVEVPYVGADGAFTPAPPSTVALHARDAMPARALERDQARASGDVGNVVALTLELAWYGLAAGLERGAVLRDVDAEVERLSLDGPMRELLAVARRDLAG